jgi:hypothetical protein
LRKSAHEYKAVSPVHGPPSLLGKIPGIHFYQTLRRPQGHSAVRRIMSMRNSSDTTGNQTCDLLPCSTVPQKTVPQHAPIRILTASFKACCTITKPSNPTPTTPTQTHTKCHECHNIISFGSCNMQVLHKQCPRM